MSRRTIWDVVQKIKRGRCVVMSTHFMDEADLLGDKIAVLAHGQIQVLGYASRGMLLYTNIHILYPIPH